MSEFLTTSVSVSSIDPQGKKFDKVSRLSAQSIDQDITIELDYNSELINITTGDELVFTLDFGNESLSDSMTYNYGMNGKVFKIEESVKTSVYASFGGLLLKIDCPLNVLSKIKSGNNCKLYLKNKKSF